MQVPLGKMMVCKNAIALVLLAAVLTASCASDPEVAKREHVQRGDIYVAQKQIREAIVEYRSAIALDATFGEARLKLGNAYMVVKEPGNAYAEFVRAADLMPTNLEAQLKTAQFLVVNGRVQDAKGRIEKALAVDPKNVDALILKGHALAGLRDVPGAINQLQEAIKLDPTRAASYANLGALQAAHGDVEEAERSYEQAIAVSPKSVDAHLALASFQWSSGRRDEAERTLKTTIGLDPRNRDANQALATFYMTSGRPAEAERHMKTVAEVTPGVDGKLALADYYTTVQRSPEAKALLEQIAPDSAGFETAKLRLAALAVSSGNRAEAGRLVDEVLGKNPKHPDALGAKAQLQLADRDTDAAIASVKAAIEAAPNAAALHLLHGQILAARYDRTGALAAYTEALQHNPRLASANVEIARLRLEEARVDDAAQFARAALAVAPGHREARLVLSRAMLLTGDHVGAEEHLTALDRDFPTDSVVQTELGRLHVVTGDRARGRAIFERLLRANPGDVGAIESLTALDYHENKPHAIRPRLEAALTAAPRSEALQMAAGRIYFGMKDTDAAEKALKNVLAINQNNLYVYSALGELYAMQKRLPEATAEFERIVQKQPGAYGAITAIAMLQRLQGRTDEARATYQKALDANPRAAVAANNLAWMYAERGDNLDHALQLAQSAKTELPDAAPINDTLGWVYYKKGLATLAVKPFQEASRAEPTNPTYHYHLGLAYAATKDTKRARQSLEKALTLDPRPELASDARKALQSLGS